MTIKEKFSNLIENYGIDSNLATFFYCNDYGCELDGSTIDKIEEASNGNIIFFYNENTNDFDTIGAFSEKSLESFYAQLKIAIWKEVGVSIAQIDMVEAYIRNKFSEIFSNERDLSEFATNFGMRVCNDIYETADWASFDGDEICLDDVDIAIARNLKEAF